MPHTNDIPEQESVIYTQLITIRSKLSTLKRDRTQYLTSKDVLSTYHEVLELVNQLKQLRATNNQQVQGNKVDQIIDDIFQLLSLFFIAVGLINTAPATYASLTTVQRLLEHLNESSVFTVHDLQPIKQRLEEITKIVNGSEESTDELDLLQFKLKQCLEDYKIVEGKVKKVDPKLQSLFEELVTIRRKLLAVASRPNFTELEIEPTVERLHKLETNHRDSLGKFQSLETHEVVIDGQNVLNGLLDECHTLINDLNAHSKLQVDATLTPIYDRLIQLKTSLEDLLVTRRWTLRQTDLYQYQKDIQEIDDLRYKNNGQFPTTDNSVSSSKAQSILLYLLRRCYAIIYKLLESSEPVSEALQPLHNQLSTVRRCLLELKRIGGINSIRELYPYQLKLASLDNLRTDGKFIVDGQIPEGQGTLTALLAECYDICQELKIEADDREAEDQEEEIGGVYDDENVQYECLAGDEDEDEDDGMDDDDEEDYQEEEEEKEEEPESAGHNATSSKAEAA